MVPLSEPRLQAGRARIAALLALDDVPAELGEIRLHSQQREMVARVRHALARNGGCLLADEVGRGKTYVALAVARDWTRPLIVVPASLRATWQEAMRRAACSYAMITHEALSQGKTIHSDIDGVIVDESHRFRNAGTRRHAMLATLAARVPLLLLSATPVQNATRDLAAQLALFLGSGAYHLDESRLVKHVVRGGDADASLTLPRLARPRWVRPAVDDGRILRAILALPPPPRAADGADAGALRVLGLVRAWASSRAALRAMLARRRRLAAAMEQSITAGRLPTMRELRAWESFDDGSVQLGFVPLLVERVAERARLDHLAQQISDERRAFARLDEVMTDADDPDVARCAELRAIRYAHPEESILAFSERATTIRAYHVMLRGAPGVGMLTATEARIASGRIGRDELLARFAPAAQGARVPRTHERVTLLLSTDLLSEGVNLQDASVVVHLDLPWNPARLTQRVGRVRRSGGGAVVHAYLMAPPASSELLLHVETRLHRKLANVASIIGATLPLLPVLTESSARHTTDATVPDRRSAGARAAMLERIARWRNDNAVDESCDTPVVAAVLSTRSGWLAAFSDGRLVASMDGGLPDEASSVADAVMLAVDPARDVRAGEAESALAAAERWIRAREASAISGASSPITSLHRMLDRRIAELLLRAPRHARGALLPLVAQLRRAMERSPSLGTERALLAHLERRADSADDTCGWLRDALSLLPRALSRAELASAQSRVEVMLLIGE